MDSAPAGIREGLSRTREQLAGTVETWAHKMDLPSSVKDKWQAAKGTMHDKIGHAGRHLHHGKETVQDKADEVTRQAKSLTNQARAHIPAPVAGRVNHLTAAVRQQPIGAVAMVLAVVAFFLLRRLFRRVK